MAVNFRGVQFQNPGEGLLQGINQGLDVVGSIERIKTQRLARDLSKLETSLSILSNKNYPEAVRDKHLKSSIPIINRMYGTDFDPNISLPKETNIFKGLNAIVNDKSKTPAERLENFSIALPDVIQKLDKEGLQRATLMLDGLKAAVDKNKPRTGLTPQERIHLKTIAEYEAATSTEVGKGGIDKTDPDYRSFVRRAQAAYDAMGIESKIPPELLTEEADAGGGGFFSGLGNIAETAGNLISPISGLAGQVPGLIGNLINRGQPQQRTRDRRQSLREMYRNRLGLSN